MDAARSIAQGRKLCKNTEGQHHGDHHGAQPHDVMPAYVPEFVCCDGFHLAFRQGVQERVGEEHVAGIAREAGDESVDDVAAGAPYK